MAELSAKKAKKDKKKEKQLLENGDRAAEALSPQQDTPVKKKSKVNGHTVPDTPSAPPLSARKGEEELTQQLLDSSGSHAVKSSPSLQQLKNERKEKQREKQEKKKQKKEERAALRSENQQSTTSVVRTARKRMLVSS